METILGLLDYQNIERIWLERTETEVRESRQRETKCVFELHVARHTESGVTYEDTIDHLSESERSLVSFLVWQATSSMTFMKSSRSSYWTPWKLSILNVSSH